MRSRTYVALRIKISATTSKDKRPALEVDLLRFDMAFEGCRREEGTHIVQEGINIRRSIAHGNGDTDIDDSIPRRGESAGQRQGPRHLGRGTTDAAENSGSLRGGALQGHVVLQRNRFGGTNVTDGVIAEGISGVGLGVDSETHVDYSISKG